MDARLQEIIIATEVPARSVPDHIQRDHIVELKNSVYAFQADLKAKLGVQEGSIEGLLSSHREWQLFSSYKTTQTLMQTVQREVSEKPGSPEAWQQSKRL